MAEQRHGIQCSSPAGDGILVEVSDLAKQARDAKEAVVQALKGHYVELTATLQETAVLQNRYVFSDKL